ncbi:MAG: fibronectin type III domain-containing protein, partial [Sediminibacterium sp.]|nr:fibronectin type III domain-containing protein [Sediminibacterium sp.]
YGAKPIYTITPNIGYEIDSIIVNGLKVDSITSFTFDSVKSNQTIFVNFKLQTFTIITSAGTGVTISPKDTLVVNYGAQPTYTIIPNAGYVIDSIIVSGIKIDNVNTYTLDSVKSDQTILVSYKFQTYTIIASAGTGGTISPVDTLLVNYGAQPTYTITPNEGYVIDSIIVNGIKINNVYIYTFDSVKLNQTILVSFKLQTYTIIASAGTGGTITPKDTSVVNYGSKPTYTFIANSGFVIDSIIVNGIKINNLNSYTFYGIKSNQTIFVKFKEITQPSKPINIKVVAGNAQAIISFSKPLNNGGIEISKYIVEVVGKNQQDSSISSPIIVTGLTNGQTYQFSVKAINLFGLISDISLSDSVTLDNNLRIIHISVINGIISDNTSVNVGENRKITYTPDEGYIIDSIYI